MDDEVVEVFEGLLEALHFGADGGGGAGFGGDGGEQGLQGFGDWAE